MLNSLLALRRFATRLSIRSRFIARALLHWVLYCCTYSEEYLKILEYESGLVLRKYIIHVLKNKAVKLLKWIIIMFRCSAKKWCAWCKNILKVTRYVVTFWKPLEALFHFHMLSCMVSILSLSAAVEDTSSRTFQLHWSVVEKRRPHFLFETHWLPVFHWTYKYFITLQVLVRFFISGVLFPPSSHCKIWHYIVVTLRLIHSSASVDSSEINYNNKMMI